MLCAEANVQVSFEPREYPDSQGGNLVRAFPFSAGTLPQPTHPLEAFSADLKSALVMRRLISPSARRFAVSAAMLADEDDELSRPRMLSWLAPQ